MNAVVGFLNASFSGVEQGPNHLVPVGYLKGGQVAGQTDLVAIQCHKYTGHCK